MQKVIETSMGIVCAETGISPEQVFIILLFFAVIFFIMSYPNKWVEGTDILCVKETAYEDSKTYFKQV